MKMKNDSYNDKISNDTKSISARIDMDIYEYLKEEGIPASNIVRILLRGFATSEDKIGFLLKCLEKDEIIKLDSDEKRIALFAEERLNTSLWTEGFLKIYEDLKKLP